MRLLRRDTVVLAGASSVEARGQDGPGVGHDFQRHAGGAGVGHAGLVEHVVDCLAASSFVVPGVQAHVLHAGGAVGELHRDLVDLVVDDAAPSAAAGALLPLGDRVRAAGDGHVARAVGGVAHEGSEVGDADRSEGEADGDAARHLPQAPARDGFVDPAFSGLARVADHDGDRQGDGQAGGEDTDVHGDAREKVERPVVRVRVHGDGEDDQRKERDTPLKKFVGTF